MKWMGAGHGRVGGCVSTTCCGPKHVGKWKAAIDANETIELPLEITLDK